MHYVPYVHPHFWSCGHPMGGPTTDYPRTPAYPYHAGQSHYSSWDGNHHWLQDYGPAPYVVDINKVTKQNNNYRTAIWTGKHLQVTLMSLQPGEDIGLEIHPDVDQFLRVEQGQGIVQMGKRRDNLDFQRHVVDDFAIMIPAGTWHNLTNTGNIPLKLYSIYAPPEHPRGTVHVTKMEAMEAE
ncbi:cupin domain-containing protein [Sediminibacillus massiliensis]|uniref:cupin domain-containing protein n=1 Tax=Sediminibacillus massiliensis TaxID=1926277 RepID=UPI00098866D1|nr:cupin domain-containing protein [Sediminibacillus massiliensis]